jgi:hypothetical protein
LISSYTPLDANHPPSEVIFLLILLLLCFHLVNIITIVLIRSFLRQIPIVSGNLHDSPDDTSEGRGSSVPVDFHTVEYTCPESEHDDLIDSEAVHTDLPSSANDACGTEVAAVFLKRRVQPVMARIRPMWLYSGAKDETRINVAELSEKELLDEVRRLTFFS